jgi:hypothetical protein
MFLYGYFCLIAQKGTISSFCTHKKLYCCKIKQLKYRKVLIYTMYVLIQTIERSMFYLLAGPH